MKKSKFWMLRFKRSLRMASIAWLAFYAAAQIHAALPSFAAVQNLDEVHPIEALDPSQMAPLVPPLDSSPAVNQSLWSKARIKAYQLSMKEHTGTPLALLRIPKFKLEVPVLDGTDEITLDRAVGRITGTALPGRVGNIGIAGHRDGFFRCLKDIHKGDAIQLVIGQRTDTYIVNEIHVTSRRNTRDLHASMRSQLTLVTCYPFYFVGSAPKRFIVHASLKH